MVQLKPDDYVADVKALLEEEILLWLRENYHRIVKGELQPKPQHGKASYVKQRTDEDGLIDLSWSAQRIYNFIRAQSNPYPGAYITRNGCKLRFWRVTLEQVD